MCKAILRIFRGELYHGGRKLRREACDASPNVTCHSDLEITVTSCVFMTPRQPPLSLPRGKMVVTGAESEDDSRTNAFAQFFFHRYVFRSSRSSGHLRQVCCTIPVAESTLAIHWACSSWRCFLQSSCTAKSRTSWTFARSIDATN